MNVYLIIMKNAGTLEEAKTFIDFEKAKISLKIRRPLYDAVALYTINISELEIKAWEEGPIAKKERFNAAMDYIRSGKGKKNEQIPKK